MIKRVLETIYLSIKPTLNTPGEIISFNHPCVCRIELSNPSCHTVVLNEVLSRLQTHWSNESKKVLYGILMVYTHLFHLMYFNYRSIVALCCSQYYRVNTVRFYFYRIYHMRNNIHVTENIIYHIRRCLKLDCFRSKYCARLINTYIIIYNNNSGMTAWTGVMATINQYFRVYIC